MIDIIEKETGLKSVIGNDATRAIYGELYVGYGKEFSNIVMVTFGIEVGVRVSELGNEK